MESRSKRKDGSEFPVEISISFWGTGNNIFFTALLRDITERKKAEEALLESEERLRSIVETAKDGVVNINSEGNIIFWNKAAEEMFGYSFDEIMGEPVTILMPPRFFENYESRMDDVVSTEQSEILRRKAEVVGLRKDGTEFPVEHSIACWETKDGIFYTTILRDVTERKKAEREIIETRDFLENVFSTTTDGIMISDPKGYVVRVNKAIEEMLGFTQKELIGKHTGELAPLDEHQVEIGTILMTHLREHGFVKNFEAAWLRKDGSLCPIELNITKFWDSEGNSPGAVSVVRDITERKQADAALRESEERFRSIMENANDTILFVDSKGYIRFWNRKAEELYGYTPDEVLGKPHSVLVPKRLQEIHNNWMEKFLSLDESAISGKIVEGIGERKDGSEFYVETSTALLKQEGETYLVAILRDITERKQAEEEKAKLEAQLRQSQKMEAVGLLAGGIAHDFNNILTAIIGYASLLQMKIKEDEHLKPHAEQILAASQRAANLTQSLLAFSRKQIINPRPLNISEIITKMEKLWGRIIGEDIDLQTTLAAGDTTVMADPGQIEQVLMNLVTNARDAMPLGGHLIISTERTEIDHTYIRAHGYGTPGEYMLISVSDTGAGMDAKTCEKIFEPFFTTKEVGKGTGLGLAMAYGIIKQHNGYINCYSEPGKGTTFKVYLPVNKEAGETPVAQQPAPEPAGGSETILVAEDDADVRKLSRETLEHFGYTVLEAVDGEDAVRVFLENKEKIHLLLLDVVMPNKNGKEAYNEIKKMRPDIKAIFISGYTANIIHQKGLLDKELDFILKPVSPADLVRKVREVLNK
jgi:PAS domain S-box-containing protein